MHHRTCIDPMMPYIPGKPIEDVKRELGLSEVIKIASNENPYGCSPKAKQAVVESMDNPQLYPDGNVTELRELVAARLHVNPDQLVFGCGTDEVIAMIGKVFINQGDECVTAETTFSQYVASVLSMGGVMVYAPMKHHTFDLDALLEKITPKTKLVFIANPNNPTGTMITEAEQERFMEKVPSNVLVIFDEAYAEYVTDPNYPNTLETLRQYKNAMLLKTFSKVYGLASLRVGYGVADAEVIKLFEKIRPPFNVTVQAQAAAVAAYNDTEFVKMSAEKNTDVLNYMIKSFDEMGLKFIPTQANFIMVDVKADSRQVFSDLMKKGYIVRPGAAFGMDTYLRVTLGTAEQMHGFIKALKEVL